MSDIGRKDLGTKIKETITPDLLKSDAQKAKEHVTGHADKLARETQPDGGKSASQQIADKMSRTDDQATHGSSGGNVGEKIKHALHMDQPHTSSPNTIHTLGSTTAAGLGNHGTGHTAVNTAHMPGTGVTQHTPTTHLPGSTAVHHSGSTHIPGTGHTTGSGGI